MKKWLALSVILIAAVIGILLNQTVCDPSEFSGEWYSASDQTLYLFQEGMIYCQKHPVMLLNDQPVSGAYTFSGKTVMLFASGVEGLEKERQLYLIHNKDESILCDRKDGRGKVFFIRAVTK